MPKTVHGLAAALPLANVNTDVIMPKRFLITITREGLADGTFADLRFHDDDTPRTDFVLNTHPWHEARILIVGDNFGCGSSREHAVWGLVQLGIQGIIGTGFAGIFYDNARKNGLALPIVSPEARDQLMQAATHEDGVSYTIDIENLVIRHGEAELPFEMNDATQTAHLEGRDDTLNSLEFADAIRKFESKLGERQRVRVIQ